MSSKFAPKRDDGQAAYVVTTSSWGRSTDRIEWAEDLRDAKERFGYTRMQHTYIRVRRATPVDMPIAETNQEAQA
jgi:hypothetical protein